MKKIFLYIISSFIASQGFSQNFQCLQYGVNRYFLNDFLRGMRIDSTITNGNTTIFYPFHSLRGAYQMFSGQINSLDSNGGSWLGKKVIMLQDGTTYFDTYWGDTVVIKTQANLGDTWTFYNDTSDRYYTAAVTAIDTLTLLGSIDSIKTLTISAYNNAGINTGDLVNNTQIKLSKNHGLYETYSIYMFPFHASDTIAYGQYKDKIMDVRDVINGFLKSYTLFNFVDPTNEQVYDFAPGDVYELLTYNPTWESDSIFSKTIYNTYVSYLVHKNVKQYLHPQYPSTVDYSFTSTILYFNADTNRLLHLFIGNMMPEEKNNFYSISINLIDTSFCKVAPLYSINTSLFSSCYISWQYKLGFGETYYSACTDPYSGDTRLNYSLKNGVPCGSYEVIDDVGDVEKDKINIFPNPVADKLNIENDNHPLNYWITDMSGKVIQNGTIQENEHQISVAQLSNGIYLLKLFDNQNNLRSNTKIVVMH